MRKYVKYSLVLFLSLTCAINAVGQDSTLEIKVTELEQKIQVLNDSLQVQAIKLKQYDRIDKDINDLSSIIENPVKWLITRGFIIAGISLGLLFLFFIILNKTNPKWYTTLIQQWIDKYEKVNVLKASKKILVVSSVDNPDNEVFLNRLLSRDGFKKVDFVAIDEAEEYLKANKNEGKVDLLFVNNENSQLSQDQLGKLLNHRKQIAMFYFGKVVWRELPVELQKRTNFANSRSQIYGNLISSLKFQETLLGLA